MCGICGEVGNSYGYTVEPALITRMMDSLVHRGPDEEGSYVHEMVGLGHRRLSIIDIKTGRQPIANEDNSIFVVLNGEIYNFQVLREELKHKGHIFQSNSDTEVIVHLYEEYGVDCIKKLRGMFAFGLWDSRSKTLMLGRDRLGKKPLYYSQLDKSLIFASEIKALFQDTRMERKLNACAVHDFLSFKFIPRREDLIKGVFELPPASILVFKEGEISITRYWDLEYKPDYSMTVEEAISKSEEILKESVLLRMISDVPLGAFLSSGLDSGLIVAMMSEASNSPVNTFSLGDTRKSFNELPHARQIAEKYHTNHKEMVCHPDAVKILPDLIWHLDGPYADVPALPMYYVAQMARQDVKVVLTGDGGDESFAGYDRYIANQILSKYRKMPAFLRQSFVPAFLNMFQEKTARKSWRQSLRWFNDLSLMPEEESYARGISFFSFENEQKDQLYTPEFKEKVKGVNSLHSIMSVSESSNIQEPLNKMTFSDLMVRVPEYSSIKIDRITMMHGLEARSPFLDHKLVEFAATIPPRFKLKNGQRKYLLKKVALEYLPKNIINLPKQGFASPVNSWLRGELRGMAHDLLSNSQLIKENLFQKPYIDKLLQEHASKKINNGNKIWSLVNLEIWYRINFGKDQPHRERENLQEQFKKWEYDSKY